MLRCGTLLQSCIARFSGHCSLEGEGARERAQGSKVDQPTKRLVEAWSVEGRIGAVRSRPSLN